MASKDCIAAIEKGLGRPATEDEIDRIASAVQARLNSKAKAGMTPRDAAREVAKEMTSETKLAAARARWVAHDNILKKADRKAELKPGNELQSERAWLSGLGSGAERNDATSIHSVHHMLRNKLLAGMVNELGPDLMKLAASGDKALDRRVAVELKRRDNPALEADTKDPNAKKIAAAMGKVLDGSRAMLNKEGAFIGKIDGYIVPQTHDMWKIRKAGFDKWREGIMADRDVEHDFPDTTPEHIQSRLQDEFQAMRSGVHDSSGVGGRGNYSVANKVSQQRTITFKSAEGWLKYNDAFGKGGVMDSVFDVADRAGRDTALMRMFGTTPKRMFDELHKENIAAAIARGDDKMSDRLKGNLNDSLFATVSGVSDTPGRATLATVGANVRSAQQMLKLGMIMGSAVSHIPINALVLRHNGVPFLEGMANQLRSLFPRTAEGKAMAASVHAGLDGMFGHVIRRFHTEDGAPGWFSGAVNVFHKANGFSYFMDAQKQGVGLALAHSLATNAGKAFEALDPKMQTSLRRYGIEAAEWDVGRASAQKAADGRNYLVPSEIADPKVSDKFQTYITDQISEGANEPTPWARNAAALGTRPGTWAGEVTRTLAQFKSFAITMGERQFGREFKRNGFDKMGSLLLVSSMTAFGFLGNQLRLLASNAYQHPPTTAEGWASLIKDSMLNGGALGLLGDMFARDGLKTGGDVLKTMLGPTAGTAADIIAAANTVREGSSKNERQTLLKNEALRVGQNDLMPNFWFLHAAYAYLGHYMIQNMVHPGAVQRHEKVLKEHSQSFIWRP